jgi:acyl-CoA dehydrogenase
MGYVEETGAAQFLRDVRVTSIYEGTNGIQAMDLVGRKMMDGGEAAFRLLDEIQAGAEAARAAIPTSRRPSGAPPKACARRRNGWSSRTEARFAGAVPYQRAFARVLGGHVHLKAALAGDGAGRRWPGSTSAASCPSMRASRAGARRRGRGARASPADLAA